MGVLTVIAIMRTAARGPILVCTGASIRNIQMGLIAEVVAKAGFTRGTAICLPGTLNPVGRSFFAIGPEAFPKVICNRKGCEKEDE